MKHLTTAVVIGLIMVCLAYCSEPNKDIPTVETASAAKTKAVKKKKKNSLSQQL